MKSIGPGALLLRIGNSGLQITDRLYFMNETTDQDNRTFRSPDKEGAIVLLLRSRKEATIVFNCSVNSRGFSCVGSHSEWSYLLCHASWKALQEEHFKLFHFASISDRAFYTPSYRPDGRVFVGYNIKN